jgi:hypothetical protein
MCARPALHLWVEPGLIQPRRPAYGRHPAEARLRELDATFARGGLAGFLAGGTFQEHVLDVFANDEHGVLLLHHEFDRDGPHREYRTAHVCPLRDGRIAARTEQPGSVREFGVGLGDAPATAGRLTGPAQNSSAQVATRRPCQVGPSWT